MRTSAYYAAWTVLFMSLTAALYSGAMLYRSERDNRIIDGLNNGRNSASAYAKNSSPQVELAYAADLKQHGRYDDALEILSQLIGSDDPKVKAASRYNEGNIYLSKAIDHAEAMRPDDAAALIELAKNAYREALFIDNQYWDAKYNLEVAIRLLPDLDRINTENDREDTKKAKPWTTIPGFPRGLP